MPPQPKKESVDSAVTDPSHAQASDLLLKHCLALDTVAEGRPSAKLRLEEAVGPELARMLLASLSQSKRR